MQLTKSASFFAVSYAYLHHDHIIYAAAVTQLYNTRAMLSHPPGTNDAFAQSTNFGKLQTSSRPVQP